MHIAVLQRPRQQRVTSQKLRAQRSVQFLHTIGLQRHRQQRVTSQKLKSTELQAYNHHTLAT